MGNDPVNYTDRQGLQREPMQDPNFYYDFEIGQYVSNNKPLGDAGRSMAMDMVAGGGLTEDFGWTGEAAQQMFAMLQTGMITGDLLVEASRNNGWVSVPGDVFHAAAQAGFRVSGNTRDGDKDGWKVWLGGGGASKAVGGAENKAVGGGPGQPGSYQVIALISTGAVVHFGHAAVLVGHQDYGWYYFSKNGTLGSSGLKGETPNPGEQKAPDQGRFYPTISDFLNDSRESSHYDFIYGMDAKKNDLIGTKNKALQATASPYHFSSQSCLDVLLQAMINAGLKVLGNSVNWPKNIAPYILFNNPNGTVYRNRWSPGMDRFRR